jgi:arginyl-tRNA synthetase
VIQNAAQNHSPALLANFVYDLVREYNSFISGTYSRFRSNRVFRVQLSKKVADTIAASFSLLELVF